MGANGNAKTNWPEMQAYYDAGHGERELCEAFDVSPATVYRASKTGKFKYRTRSEASQISHAKFPQKHSPETKQKISKARRKFLAENPDKVPYLLNHYSKGDSYPEKYFEAAFRQEGIVLTKKLQVGTYQLDFCDPIKMVDIEIDGDQHYLDPRIIASDHRRNKWLEERGWKVIRIRWSYFKKMSMDGRRAVVDGVWRALS